MRGGRARRPRPPPTPSSSGTRGGFCGLPGSVPPTPGRTAAPQPVVWPTWARPPLRGCHPPPRCRCTHTPSPLRGGGALLFLHPAPHTPPRPREPSAGMINTVCVAGRAPGPRPPPWNLGPLELGPGQDGRSGGGGGGGPDAPAMAQRTRTMCTCGRTRSPWSLSACNRVAPVGKVAWDPGGWGGWMRTKAYGAGSLGRRSPRTGRPRRWRGGG